MIKKALRCPLWWLETGQGLNVNSAEIIVLLRPQDSTYLVSQFQEKLSSIHAQLQSSSTPFSAVCYNRSKPIACTSKTPNIRCSCAQQPEPILTLCIPKAANTANFLGALSPPLDNSVR
jgi:hypothetical protein